MGLAGGPKGVLRFGTIPQPWLRNQVLRWLISTGKSYHQINRDITALQRLVDAFTAQAGRMPDLNSSAGQRSVLPCPAR